MPDHAARRGQTAPILRLSRFYPAWEVLLWAVVSAVVINPFRETAVMDDWAYARMVKSYLETGIHEADAWVAANPLMQIQWGALFSYVFGFSQATLRLSTLVLAGVGVGSFYLLARDHDLGKRQAAMLALVFAASPLFLQLSFTFMTDVPFLSFLLLSMLLYGRALCSGRLSLFVAASLAGAAAVLTRQFGAVLVPAVVLTGVVVTRARPGVLMLSVLLPGLATVYQLWLGTAAANWTAERLMYDQGQHLGSIASVGEAAWRCGVVLIYLALFSLPLAVPLIRRRLAGGDSYRVEAIVGLLLVLTILAGATAGHPLVLPFLPWNLDVIELWPISIRATLTASVVLVAAFVGGCIWRRYQPFRRSLTASEWLLDAIAALYLISQLAFVQFGDEYLLPLLPYVLIVIGRDLWRAQPEPAFLVLRVVTVTVLLLSALHHRASLSVSEARWIGAEMAMQLGARPERISASWEWESYNGSFDRFVASGTGDSSSSSLRAAVMDYFSRWLPDTREQASFLSVALNKPPGVDIFKVEATVPYRDMFFRSKTVYVISRPLFALRSCSGGHATERDGSNWWRWTPDRLGCTFVARDQTPAAVVVGFEYWTPTTPRDVIVTVGTHSVRTRLLSNGRRSFRTVPLPIAHPSVAVEIELADGSVPHRLSDTDARSAAFLIKNLSVEPAE